MKAFLSLFAQQIASSVIDQPYSGFVVNQNIEETYTILQYETERFTAESDTTFTLSMPSGLASNKHYVLFISSDKAATANITTRDYANLADNLMTVDISAEEPFYACLHDLRQVTIEVVNGTGIQSFVAKVQATSATSSAYPNQGLDPGSLPVGGIIALSGAFSSPGTGYSETGILPLPSYLQLCDGSLCNDADSIFYGKYLPNITGQKTLVGSTTAGVSSTFTTTGTILTGFGADWNIYQEIPVSANYSVRYFMRIK